MPVTLAWLKPVSLAISTREINLDDRIQLRILKRLIALNKSRLATMNPCDL
jgi:hypothetical protein